MSREGPRLTPVARETPKQEKLPLPDPPARPFVALARESRVGGPVRKLVYMMVATFCPVMAYSWVATGRIKRETLRQACELKKVDTLDTHLRQLRADGFLNWRRTPGASIFEVRLSPLRVLEAMADSAKRFGPKAVAPPAHRSELSGAGESVPVAPSDSPSKGGAAARRGVEAPLDGESGARVAPPVTPSQGESPGELLPLSPSEGESIVPVPPGLHARVSPCQGVTPSGVADSDLPSQGESRGVAASARPTGHVAGSPGAPAVVSGSPGQGQAETAFRGESRTPVPGGAEVAAEGVSEVRPTAAAAGAIALAPAAPASIPAPMPNDRRFKLLEVAADRLFAGRAHELWLHAPDVAVQAQISAAVQFRDGHRWARHTHKAVEEVVVSVGVERIGRWKTVVQRCECGAARFVTIDRDGLLSEYVPWTLCGLVAAFVTDEAFFLDRPPPSLACEPVALEGWREPLTWSDVDILHEKGQDGGDRLPGPVERPPELSSPGQSEPEVEGSPALVSCPRCGGQVPLPEIGVAGCVLCL